MDKTKSLKELNYFINTTRGDILLLKNLAEKVGSEEFDEMLQQHHIVLPTTVREGPPDNPQTFIRSRCTIPLTMACFAVLDFIGTLLSDSNVEEKGVKDEFQLHAKRFLNQLLNNHDIDRQNAAEKLQSIYRNGIMHNYLPVGNIDLGYSVSYSGFMDEHTLFIEQKFDRAEVILNVKCLTALTISGLSAFETLLMSDQDNRNIILQYNQFLETNRPDY
jgi:hypothetical protein